MAKLTARRVRAIRGKLGFSRNEFARALWVGRKTVYEWEAGRRSPVGMHRRLLLLLEHGLLSRSFRTSLRDPRAADPLFLLYRLLEPLYESTLDIGTPVR
jgi:transcriptional regulator with XRE-family HTH domain